MTEEKKEELVRIVKCPSCRKAVRYDASNPWRPFCSKVCKTLDIAAWAEEEYRVPGAPLDPYSEHLSGEAEDGHEGV